MFNDAPPPPCWPTRPQLQAAPAPPPSSSVRLISMEEVEKHDSKESAWFVVDGRVYDATPFLKEHPGERVPFSLWPSTSFQAKPRGVL